MQPKSKNGTIEKIEEEIIEEFSLFEDWMDKYEHIIDMGKSLEPLDEKYKTELNRVHGCQSNVWLHATRENGNIVYRADSDAIITKGLIALLIRVLSGQPAESVVNAELKFIDEIGMKEHLTPTRANGLLSMIGKMKRYAEDNPK